MKNYIQPGTVLSLTAPAALKSGDGFLVGAIFGVAAFDADAGAPIEAAVTGVFSLPKASGVSIAQGAKVYFDSVAGSITTTATGNALIGAAVEAAGSSATVAKIRLNGTV